MSKLTSCLGHAALALLLVAGGTHAATLTVINSDDAGPGSLRQAITDAAPGDTIIFDLTQVSSPIILTGGDLAITQNLTVQGPGATQLAISGGHASRIFAVSGSATVVLDGLSLQDGRPTSLDGGPADGGAIYHDGGTLTVSRSILRDNAADYGGGIYNASGTLTVRHSTLSGNLAESGGGGIMNEGAATLASSTVSENFSYSAGGLFNLGAMTVVNCTLSGNSAYYGGGILNYVFLERVQLQVSHSTLSGNTAPVGGGILNERDPGYFGGASLMLDHTLLASGAAGGNYEDYGDALAVSLGYNLSDDGTPASFLTGPGDVSGVLSLLLGPLQDNGGVALTHALLPGSPAIDAGDRAFDASGLPFDGRGPGFARIANQRVDIGTFELSGCDTPVATITGPVSESVYRVNTPVSFTATFTGANGPHTAQWTIGGETLAGTVDESAKTISVTVTFAEAGVYPVQLSVANACGNQSSTENVGGLPAKVVIYDPNAGFVTGGGWFHSPAGAVPGNPALTGKANLSFTAKYKKDRPALTGELEFQFKAASVKFKSKDSDWLVIRGAQAQLQGTGTLNGAAGFSYRVTAIDGRCDGGGVDRCRMQIWETASRSVVYDSQPGAADSAAPTTALDGGSIVIHD